jgi:hypothetical protein
MFRVRVKKSNSIGMIKYRRWESHAAVIKERKI